MIKYFSISLLNISAGISHPLLNLVKINALLVCSYDGNTWTRSKFIPLYSGLQPLFLEALRLVSLKPLLLVRVGGGPVFTEVSLTMSLETKLKTSCYSNTVTCENPSLLKLFNWFVAFSATNFNKVECFLGALKRIGEVLPCLVRR